MLLGGAVSDEWAAGALLLQEAEATYSADLLHYAGNLWSLVGMRNCLQLRLRLSVEDRAELTTLLGESGVGMVEVELREKLATQTRKVVAALTHSSPDVRVVLLGDATMGVNELGGASCFCAGRKRGNQPQ